LIDGWIDARRPNQPELTVPRGSFDVTTSPTYGSATFHEYLTRTIQVNAPPPKGIFGRHVLPVDERVMRLPSIDAVDVDSKRARKLKVCHFD